MEYSQIGFLYMYFQTIKNEKAVFVQFIILTMQFWCVSVLLRLNCNKNMFLIFEQRGGSVHPIKSQEIGHVSIFQTCGAR